MVLPLQQPQNLEPKLTEWCTHDTTVPDRLGLVSSSLARGPFCHLNIIITFTAICNLQSAICNRFLDQGVLAKRILNFANLATCIQFQPIAPNFSQFQPIAAFLEVKGLCNFGKYIFKQILKYLKPHLP